MYRWTHSYRITLKWPTISLYASAVARSTFSHSFFSPVQSIDLAPSTRNHIDLSAYRSAYSIELPCALVHQCHSYRLDGRIWKNKYTVKREKFFCVDFSVRDQFQSHNVKCVWLVQLGLPRCK